MNDWISKDSSITIGEMAKSLNVSVRTLQYYDKEGILKPSATTIGGRRFYTKHDIVKAHQILSMKYLGFSLDDIKNRLTTLTTKRDVVQVLELQKVLFQEQIHKLTEALSATDTLLQEAMQMQAVDFERYAKIVVMLRKKSDSYWLFKLFNDRLSRHISDRFSANPDAWASLFERWKNVCDTTILLDNQRENPTSAPAQALAQEWWSITLDFCGEDLSIIDELQKFEQNSYGWDEEMKQKIELSRSYRKKIMEIYLKKENIGLCGIKKEGKIK